MSNPEQNNQRESPPAPGRRRSSFVDMFNARGSVSQNPQPPRRLSITTLGLTTLPGQQTSPFNNMRNRTESVSSANSGSVDESPFEDDHNGSPQQTTTSVPATPFGRRMSFGAARTLRGQGSGNAQNGANANGSANEGFDFAENVRARAQRTSISGNFGIMSQPQGQTPVHNRSKSVVMEPPPRSELPKQTRPDAFQERILKGDFYMD
jgi:hypothetical protein